MPNKKVSSPKKPFQAAGQQKLGKAQGVPNVDKKVTRPPKPDFTKRVKEGSMKYEDQDDLRRFFEKSTVTPTNSIRNDLQSPGQQGAKGGWKKGISPAHKIAAQMAADAKSEKVPVLEQETERFNRGKLTAFSTKWREYVYRREAYKIYSNNYFYSIMNALSRTGKAPAFVDETQVTPEAIEKAKWAMQVIEYDMKKGENSKVEADRTVYRGIGTDKYIREQLNIEDGLSDEELNQRLQGAIVSDKALTSTSFNPNKAKTFANMNRNQEGTPVMMQIHVPKGLAAQYITPVSEYQDEDELLADRDTPMRYIDVKSGKDADGKNYRLVRGSYLLGRISGHRRNKKN